MKRGNYFKILALSVGLISIPFFNVVSNAFYFNLGKGGSFNIVGDSVSTYKVFVPNNEGCEFIPLEGIKIKSNDLISKQLQGNIPEVISNYVFTNNVFKESTLTTSYGSLDTLPTGDLYLEYSGYFVKGSEDTTLKQLEYNAATKSFSLESIFKGYDILGYKKIATKPETEIQSYTNLGNNDGIYNVSIFENKVIADRAIYFQPNAETWTKDNAKFGIEYFEDKNNKERFLSMSDDGFTYKFLIPARYKQFRFLRFNPAEVDTNINGKFWNKSGDIYLNDGKYSSINSKVIQNNSWDPRTPSTNYGAYWSSI